MDEHIDSFRVLHVVASTDRRGAETAAVELSRSLERQGMPGEVVALTAGALGGLDLATLGPWRFAPRTLRAMRARAAEASVVVAHGSSTLPAAAAATLGTTTPFVYRSIGDPRAWSATPARKLRVGLAARRAAGLVALWPGAAVTWHCSLRVRPERIAVIPNGVSAERFRPPGGKERIAARAALGLAGEGPVIVYLGSLSPEKRVDLAIRATGAIKGARLAVVGDGPERERLQAMAARVGDRVRIVGPTREPWGVLAAADALVLPSDTEGQPAVAIEAGLMGIPVVATSVGGVPEIVLDGRTGRLVKAGDVGALEAGLRDVLTGRREFGEQAREHCIRFFSLDQVAEKWAFFLQSVIKTGAIPEQHSD